MGTPQLPVALSRRVRQTRSQIEAAFGALIAKTSYESIHIADVTERAGVARTTFYLHYASKDALFLSWAENNLINVNMGFVTRDEWLAEEPAPQLSALFHTAQHTRMQRRLTFSDTKDASVLMYGMDNLIAAQFEKRLHASFDESHSRIPFAVLAQSIAGSLTRLMGWWLETHTCTAEEAAHFAQQIISTTIRGAIRL